MIRIKTFESFIVRESKENMEVIGIFGPNDHKHYIEVQKSYPQLKWFLSIDEVWKSNITPGTLLVLLKQGGLVHRLLFFLRHGNDEGSIAHSFDARITNLDPSESARMITGMKLTLKVLCEYGMKPEKGIDVYEVGKAIMDSCGRTMAIDSLLGVDSLSLQKLLTAAAKKSITYGRTPTKLLSIIRRLFPHEFDKEFNNDNMAADMGDLGF
jgi:hypothetical protein